MANYSRFIHSRRIETVVSAKIRLYTIKEALKNTCGEKSHDLRIQLITDGGFENKGALLDWINNIEAPPIVKKLTARTEEFSFSNSMAESTHSIYKSEFLQGKHSIDKEDHLKNITLFFNYYNNNRFPFEFYCLTLMEVLNGEKPDKTKYREQIQNAQKDRLKENRDYNGCTLVCS